MRYSSWRDILSPDSPSEFRTFVPNAESLMNRVGMDDLPDGAERVDSGQSVDTANTVFAGPGDLLFPSDVSDDHPRPVNFDVYDRGVALPLGGGTFALGALATPNAQVGGQSANPLVGMGTEQLLQQRPTREVLAQAGLTDAEAVEWLAGPRAISSGGEVSTTLLGTETAVERFLGVVSSEDGPFGVSVKTARVTPDDHVVAASVLRRPVGTAEGGMAAVEGSGWGMVSASSGSEDGQQLNVQAREFTAETMARLEQG